MFFTNCGVRHVQDIRIKEVAMDQLQFASSLKPIAHPQLLGGKPEDDCCEILHSLYMSLLGAVAYLAHTRMDDSVFVCSLQRHTHKPKIEHVKRLNNVFEICSTEPSEA